MTNTWPSDGATPARNYRVTWTDLDGKMGSVELWERTSVLEFMEALHSVEITDVYVIDLRTGKVL